MSDPLDPTCIKYIDVDGIRTRYFESGSGDPIVLIHGGHFGIFVPMGIEVWSENVEALSRHGRVVAFDKLGQGWTDLPRADEDWTFEAVLQHARSFLELLDLYDITLVGHSRGGLLAARLAIELPERVRRLVVVSSASAAPGPHGGADMRFYDDVERSAPTDAGAAGVISHYHAAQAVSEGDLSAEYLRLAAEMMEHPKHGESVEGYRRNCAAHWQPSLDRAREHLLAHLDDSGFGVPTLLVWGKDDRSAPLERGQQFFEIVARKTDLASMYIVNRAGHQVFRDRPEFFNGAVAAFVSS
jgi:pimeloyl-ACP methyl ester carboxylesterase